LKSGLLNGEAEKSGWGAEVVILLLVETIDDWPERGWIWEAEGSSLDSKKEDIVIMAYSDSEELGGRIVIVAELVILLCVKRFVLKLNLFYNVYYIEVWVAIVLRGCGKTPLVIEPYRIWLFIRLSNYNLNDSTSCHFSNYNLQGSRFATLIIFARKF